MFTPDGRVRGLRHRALQHRPRRRSSPDRCGWRGSISRRRVVRPISGFLSGKHLSPQISADGRTLTFIADPDGVSNLYRMPIDGGPIERVSSVPTGVAGHHDLESGAQPVGDLRPPGVQRVRRRRPFDLRARSERRGRDWLPQDSTSRSALLPGRATPAGDVCRYLSDYGARPAAGSPGGGRPERTAAS